MDRKGIQAILKLSLAELTAAADAARRKFTGDMLDLCTITNAKSGLCSEDCRFCAQSARHSTSISTYPLKKSREMLDEAQRARDNGAARFGIVTSGNTLSKDETERIAETVSDIRRKVGIAVCASLGRLDEDGFRLLKEAGLGRYHHNIETSSSYFKKVVTSHSFEERLDTIRAAKKAGLETCSGGIIGMGESETDRIEMALTLKDLGVDSVPINVLVPIKGTLFETLEPMAGVDVIRTIALFRLVLGNVTINLAAGRETLLKDFQALAFMAGANGMLIGGYLTVKGRSVDEDKKFIGEIEKAWKR